MRRSKRRYRYIVGCTTATGWHSIYATNDETRALDYGSQYNYEVRVLLKNKRVKGVYLKNRYKVLREQIARLTPGPDQLTLRLP